MTTKPSDKYPNDARDRSKTVTQIIWGVALVLAGAGVFFRIPQVMPKIEKIEWFSSSLFFVRFCFYLLGVLLIAGGSKKIYHHYRKLKTQD
jgi:hypothetical protein